MRQILSWCISLPPPQHGYGRRNFPHVRLSISPPHLGFFPFWFLRVTQSASPPTHPPLRRGKKFAHRTFPLLSPEEFSSTPFWASMELFRVSPPQKSFWPTHGTVSTTLPSLTPFFCPWGRSQVLELKEFCCCCCCHRGGGGHFLPSWVCYLLFTCLRYVGRILQSIFSNPFQKVERHSLQFPL